MKVAARSLSCKEAKDILDKQMRFKDNNDSKVRSESALQKCKRGSEIYLKAKGF